ncbi:MAG: hypothetical protein JEZ06_11620 [Anaerolineaceae bacterium]|nr:hypothetical protein [Anaerolineaceae bacterium]
MNTNLAPPDKNHKRIGVIFNTPLTIKGISWFPLTQLITWEIMARWAKRRNPLRSWLQSMLVGFPCMLVMLTSEWCHNLAHAAVANFLGKPADAIKIQFGMPLLVFKDINDPAVSPEQHISRALGGPSINIFLLGVSSLLKRFSREGTSARNVLDVAQGTNLFLSTISFLPIPGIDGGSILKWIFVKKGFDTSQADEFVRKTNWFVSLGTSISAYFAFKKRKTLLGVFFTMLTGTALAIASRLIKEQN